MNQRGFTLIELILVAAVMGILIVGTLLVFKPLEQIAKSNDTRRKSDLVQIQRLLETYYQDNGSYPSYSTNSPSYRLMNLSGVTVDWGSSFQPYINILPRDPRSPSRTYVYYSPNSQTYYLYASLERGALDPQACNAGNTCPNVPAGVYCGGTNVCNYGLSSPNVTP